MHSEKARAATQRDLGNQKSWTMRTHTWSKEEIEQQNNAPFLNVFSIPHLVN